MKYFDEPFYAQFSGWSSDHVATNTKQVQVQFNELYQIVQFSELYHIVQFIELHQMIQFNELH